MALSCGLKITNRDLCYLTGYLIFVATIMAAPILYFHGQVHIIFDIIWVAMVGWFSAIHLVVNLIPQYIQIMAGEQIAPMLHEISRLLEPLDLEVQNRLKILLNELGEKT